MAWHQTVASQILMQGTIYRKALRPASSFSVHLGPKPSLDVTHQASHYPAVPGQSQLFAELLPWSAFR